MPGLLSDYASEILAMQWIGTNSFTPLYMQPKINTFRTSLDDINLDRNTDINPFANYAIVEDISSIDDSVYFSVRLKNNTNSNVTIKQIALYNSVSRYEMNAGRGQYIMTANNDLREWDKLYSFNQRLNMTADVTGGLTISAGTLNLELSTMAWHMMSGDSKSTSFNPGSEKAWFIYDFSVPTKINEFYILQSVKDWNIVGIKVFGSNSAAPKYNSIGEWTEIGSFGQFTLKNGIKSFLRFDNKIRYRNYKYEISLPQSQDAFTIEDTDMYFSSLFAKIPVNIFLPKYTDISERVKLTIGS